MKCPVCSNQDTKVIETRESADSTRRRRECLGCNERFTTYERFEQILNVLKKDGKKEKFCTDKLSKGVTLSLTNRPVTQDQIHALIKQVEQEVSENFKEVQSHVIGEMVMKHLATLDEVAYIRYASVCKNFKDSESFAKEVDKLNQQKENEEMVECKL